MNAELIVPSKENALEVYQKQNGLDPFLEHIRKEIDSFVPDVTTKKGRDAIASIAYKVSKSKTALDDIGKDLVQDLKELPKKIDAERKRVRELLDSWRDEVRKPLTEWEEAEESRIATIQTNIEGISRSCHDLTELEAITIQRRIETIESIFINKEKFQEYETEALHAKESALAQLRKSLEKRNKYDSDQKELAKLRAEAEAKAQRDREERIAREAEERALKVAEDKAKAEKEASEHRELELRLQVERAQKEKLQAIEQEKKRVADELVRLENEKIAREKDKQHRAKVNNNALADLIKNGISEECAKSVIVVIAKKLISNININY